MSDLKAFVERMVKIFDDAMAANTTQIVDGQCPDFETYKYMSGIAHATRGAKDRMLFEYRKMQKELVDDGQG